MFTMFTNSLSMNSLLVCCRTTENEVTTTTTEIDETLTAIATRRSQSGSQRDRPVNMIGSNSTGLSSDPTQLQIRKTRTGGRRSDKNPDRRSRKERPIKRRMRRPITGGSLVREQVVGRR